MSNTRLITAIIAFVATFVFSAGLVRLLFGAPEPPPVSYNYNRTRCFDRQAKGIESFILKDISNGEERIDKISRHGGWDVTPASEYFTEFATAVDQYSRTSGSMDASHLPHDLQIAWNKHMNAWRNYADYLNETQNRSGRKAIGEEDYREAQSLYNTEINRTWYEVLRIARTHGANVY